jgi:capsular exopolysaccharide synthesis family protein
MHTTKNDENYIIELFKTILPYKWSIFFIMLLAVILMNIFLYFIPPTYESYSILKVKINNNPMKTEDVLRDSINSASNVGVKQEMLTLQTFKTNKTALEQVDFSIQYFIKKDYKYEELYKSSPIRIVLNDQNNLKEVKGKVLFTPKKEGFTLTSETLGESEIFEYDKEIITPYFVGKVKKELNVSQPIYLLFNGSLRNIHEKIIRKRLAITQVDIEANLIKVAFQDTIHERATEYIKALIQAYISQNLKNKDNTNNKVLTFLDVQLQTMKSKLEKSEAELQNYKSQNRVEPTVKSQDSFEKLSAIDLDLSELTLKEKLAKNLMTFVRNNRNLDAIGPTLLEFNDQATIKYINTLEELQQQEDELTVEFTDQYPALITLRKKINRTKNKIILNIQSLRTTLSAKRSNLEQQKAKYENILKELPQKEKALIHFQRDYEVNSKMYTYLLEKKSENELIKVASTSNYEVIDDAYAPSKPVKPRRVILMIVAAMLGLIIAVLISLLRALFVDKVTTHKEIKLMTKLSVYGVIPLYDNVMFSTSRLKEAYHQLATNLQFSKQKDVGSIILVSSNLQGEGKTTTTVHLAGVFQNSNYKTIVIDLNLREPALHGHFGINQQFSGMSTYLSQQDNIGNILFSTNYPSLDIIPAGPIPPNPSELMLSPRLNELFETLKHKYDYIFIDTAPYSEALETLYLMKFTTMNLILLREKVSKKSTITELEKIIQEKGIENIGLVLQSRIKDNKQKEQELLNSSPTNSPKFIS